MAILLLLCLLLNGLYLNRCSGFIVGRSPPLKIASFNIQVFGQTKIAHQDIVDILIKIITRYDIIEVLEIRDSSDSAFEYFRVALNSYATKNLGHTHVYEKVESNRLGRTNSKEQYGFLYKPSKVSVTGTYQYHDIHDYFEREPFGVRFSSPTTVVSDFAIIAAHIKPSMAQEEMDNLTKVYTSFYRHWHVMDMMIAGDFNADCKYVSHRDWDIISLWTNTRFTWLGDHSMDTTVADSSCSYDKFVVAGDNLPGAVVPGSVKAYRFDDVMNLDKATALRVSDHYPIEMELEGKCHVVHVNPDESKCCQGKMILTLFIGIYITLLDATNCSGFVLDQVDGRANAQSIPPLAEPPLKIASFNIQVFGRTKFGHHDVVDILVQILSRYDIIQVLEIRDSSQTVFEGLRVALNNYVIKHVGPGRIYDKVESDRLGRTSSKEQYGFLYKPALVTLTDTYQYPDNNDYFEREPFGVRFKSPTTVVEDFVMIANHIRPASAAEEMDNLTTVYSAFQQHWNVNDIIISGDFNADCNYLKLSDWNNISLRIDPRFTWLVEDGTDTTVSESSCSYDRFVVAGGHLDEAVVPGSVKAYRYDELMALNKSTGLRVSDHYPIEMELKGKPHVSTQQNLQTSIAFTVKDTAPVASVNNIRNIYHDPSCAGSQYDVKLKMEHSHMDFVTARISLPTASDVLTELSNFRANCPGTISGQLLSMTYAYLDSAFLTKTPVNVYGLMYFLKKNVFDTEIKCSLQLPYVCGITVSKQISGH